MRPVPWWTLAATVSAEVVLVGGWTVAASVQRARYDPATQTISVLASQGATDRWMMTGTFVWVGLCYLVTALGLRPAAPPGRIALAAAGTATLLVAVFPQPAVGSSDWHIASVTTAFVAMGVWPVLACGRGPDPPWCLRPEVSRAVAAILAVVSAWFLWELNAGTIAGLAERITVGADAFWPALVAAGARWARAARPAVPPDLRTAPSAAPTSAKNPP